MLHFIVVLPSLVILCLLLNIFLYVKAWKITQQLMLLQEPPRVYKVISSSTCFNSYRSYKVNLTQNLPFKLSLNTSLLTLGTEARGDHTTTLWRR